MATGMMETAETVMTGTMETAETVMEAVETVQTRR
jgi:hypothetical protein